MSEEVPINSKTSCDDAKVQVCDQKYTKQVGRRTSSASNTKRRCFLALKLLLPVAIVIVCLSLYFFNEDSPSLASSEDRDAESGRENRSTDEFVRQFEELRNSSMCMTVFGLNLTAEAPPKGACLVNQSMGFFEAFDFCESRQMALLTIADDSLKRRVFEQSAATFGEGHGTSIWINGLWSEGRQKWVSYPDGDELGIGAELAVDEFCLKVASPVGKSFGILSFPCHYKFYFYCEFPRS